MEWEWLLKLSRDWYEKEMYCRHMCMCMRGVQKVGSRTVTSAVLGSFRRDPKTRSEFFSNINRG